MNYLTNHEQDETPTAWEVCDKCHEPDPHLEDVGECEDAQRWCVPCLHTEAMRMREEDDRDAEMRSIRGATDAELERF
jgi:hypothetical protein